MPLFGGASLVIKGTNLSPAATTGFYVTACGWLRQGALTSSTIPLYLEGACQPYTGNDQYCTVTMGREAYLGSDVKITLTHLNGSTEVKDWNSTFLVIPGEKLTARVYNVTAYLYHGCQYEHGIYRVYCYANGVDSRNNSSIDVSCYPTIGGTVRIGIQINSSVYRYTYYETTSWTTNGTITMSVY